MDIAERARDHEWLAQLQAEKEERDQEKAREREEDEAVIRWLKRHRPA